MIKLLYGHSIKTLNIVINGKQNFQQP